MKKIVLTLFAVTLLFACSEDPITQDRQDAVLPMVEVDLSKMSPNPAFDDDIRGTYTGSIFTSGLQDHGVLYINAGNDGNFQAYVVTKQDKYSFVADGTSIDSGMLSFTGINGSFDVILDEHGRFVSENVVLNGQEGSAAAFKETGGAKFGIVLGSWGVFGDTQTGAWDYILDQAATILIEASIFQKPNGGVRLEQAALGEYEIGTSGCYTFGMDPDTGETITDAPPFYISSNIPATPADTQIEVYMINQTVDFPLSTDIVVYDVGFSKAICDANGFTYNRFLGWPQATLGPVFGSDPVAFPPGCYNFAADGVNGYWARLDDMGAVLTIGFVLIDSSTFVPPPPVFGPRDYSPAANMVTTLQDSPF